jgi:hypothetical protein
MDEHDAKVEELRAQLDLALLEIGRLQGQLETMRRRSLGAWT